MVSFVNPGCLDSLPKFERVLAAPINKSRDRNATAAERELGEQRSRRALSSQAPLSPPQPEPQPHPQQDSLHSSCPVPNA
jgi:hypothetical protein